jgi:RNA polymerase sigma-70 factor (ECF subfamily)
MIMMNDQKLSHLMEQTQAGDKIAYGQLLAACEQWLRRYFTYRIEPGMVDDLIQETLISLHKKRASFDPDRPFLPWLAAIARYRWVDALRQSYRRKEDCLDDDWAAEPEIEAHMARISIHNLLQHLPIAQSEAIRLVKITGLSVAEAAQKTGQSEPLIKVNIHRGLKRLATLCEKA